MSIYMKEDEFARRIRKSGMVILGNEVIADHYTNLLKEVFKDLKCVKIDRTQYIYTNKGRETVLHELERLEIKLTSQLAAVSKAIEMLGESG